MDTVLAFLAGMFVGALIAVVIYACCVVAGNSDDITRGHP